MIMVEPMKETQTALNSEAALSASGMLNKSNKKSPAITELKVYCIMNILSWDSNTEPDTSLGCRSFH